MILESANAQAISKTYTWEEIRECLKKKLTHTSHIFTYGTIGSCNVDHDIDTIVTKKPGSTSADFFQELHLLFNHVDEYLRTNHNARLIRTSRFSDEEESKYIAGYEAKDLVFQVMSYVSLKQINMHWFDSINSSDPVSEIEAFLRSSYKCIKGEPDSLFDHNFAQYKYEELFIRLNDSDRINSKFPEQFLVQRMNVLYDFVMRKRMGVSSHRCSTAIDCQRIFYDVCSFLDNS